MEETRSSLLVRVRDPNDSRAWTEFTRMYRPFLLNIARKLGLPDDDAEEAVSEVLAVCVQRLPSFQYDQQKGSFRGWLKTVTRNKINDFWRRGQRIPRTMNLDAVGEPAMDDDVWRNWDRDYRQRVLEQVLIETRQDTSLKTWQCFEWHVLNQQPAGEVGVRLGLKANAVYQNAHRVLQQIRKRCVEFEEELVGV